MNAELMEKELRRHRLAANLWRQNYEVATRYRMAIWERDGHSRMLHPDQKLLQDANKRADRAARALGIKPELLSAIFAAFRA
jgi:hypothetical protein